MLLLIFNNVLLLPSSFDNLKQGKGKRGTCIEQFYSLCTHEVTQRFGACFQLFYCYFLKKKNLAGDMETVMIIFSIDMMPLRLVSSFTLSIQQIKTRLFPHQGGYPKLSCNACRNGGTNEGKKISLRSRPGHNCALGRLFNEYFASLFFLLDTCPPTTADSGKTLQLQQIML